MERKICMQVAITILFLLSTEAFAQGPPVNTDTPIFLGLEGRGARIRTVIVRKTQLYQNGKKIEDPFGTEISATTFPIAIPYNVTTDLLVGVIVPVRNITIKSTGSTRKSFGLGDVEVLAKYLLLQVDRKGKTFRVAGKSSVKLATGSKNIDPPLGSGTVDYSLGTVAAWIGLKYGVYGDVSYSFNGSSNGLSHGNSLTYNAAFGYRLIPAVYDTYPTQVVNLYLELNGKYASRNKLIGQEVANSGGNEVFVSPAIQYIPSRILLVEGSVQIPIVNSLNGTQLGTDFMVNLGVRVLLF